MDLDASSVGNHDFDGASGSCCGCRTDALIDYLGAHADLTAPPAFRSTQLPRGGAFRTEPPDVRSEEAQPTGAGVGESDVAGSLGSFGSTKR